MKFRYQMLLVLLALVLVFALGLAGSYASYKVVHTSKTEVASVGCFGITFDEGTSISIENSYPVSDLTGLSLSPYTFKITNYCDIASKYSITLNTLNTNTLDYSSIKYALYTADKPSTGVNLSGAELNSRSTNLNIDSLDKSFVIGSGSLESGEEVSYNLLLWIDEAAGNEEMNKTFESVLAVINEANV